MIAVNTSLPAARRTRSEPPVARDVVIRDVIAGNTSMPVARQTRSEHHVARDVMVRGLIAVNTSLPSRVGRGLSSRSHETS